MEVEKKTELAQYKVSDATKQRAEAAHTASGIKEKGAFFEYMLAVFELQQAKDGNVGYREQLEELEYHTRRTSELYLSMIQTEHARRMDLEQQQTEKMEQASSELFSALAEIKSLKESLNLRIEENAELLESRDALNGAIKQLEALRIKDEELSESYKKQIAELSKIVAEQKEEADKAIELEAASLRHSKQAEQLASELFEARKSLEKATEKHETDVKRLEDSFNERSQVAETRAQLAQGQAVLEIETRLRAEKAASDTANNETIRKLYEQLDALRQQLSDAKSSNDRVAETGSHPDSKQNDGTK